MSAETCASAPTTASKSFNRTLVIVYPLIISARSDGNFVITSSSLASAIFATFSYRTENTTTRSERTDRCRRTRRFGVMCAQQGACVRRRSWAGYTINMFEFEFPTGTAVLGPADARCGSLNGEHLTRAWLSKHTRGTVPLG